MAAGSSGSNSKAAIARLMSDLKEITMHPTEVIFLPIAPINIQNSFYIHMGVQIRSWPRTNSIANLYDNIDDSCRVCSSRFAGLLLCRVAAQRPSMTKICSCGLVASLVHPILLGKVNRS